MRASILISKQKEEKAATLQTRFQLIHHEATVKHSSTTEKLPTDDERRKYAM